MPDASNMIFNKNTNANLLYISILCLKVHTAPLKKRFFLLLFPILGFTWLKLMHFPLSKLQNHICISVHWLSFHRFGKTREWVNKEFSCKAEPCLYWASAVSQQLSMFPSLIVSKLSFFISLCSPVWGSVKWHHSQRECSDFLSMLIHTASPSSQRELMDFDDGKRGVRGRLGLRRIHSHAAACHQQVLTTHSRHFSSHAHPGADPGCPADDVREGACHSRPSREEGYGTERWRRTGSGGMGCRGSSGPGSETDVPGTVALVERVGRCGSLARQRAPNTLRKAF